MMTNKIELTHDELLKLNQVLESYVEQQKALREKTGTCDEDENNDQSLMTLRAKIYSALKPPQEKEYNIFFV